MRRIGLVLVCMLGGNAAATPPPPPGLHLQEREIHQASELVPWCRQEAEARYVGRGRQVAQWSASYSDYSNTLRVGGRLRVRELADVKVQCRIARGARERYATISFEEPAS